MSPLAQIHKSGKKDLKTNCDLMPLNLKSKFLGNIDKLLNYVHYWDFVMKNNHLLSDKSMLAAQ